MSGKKQKSRPKSQPSNHRSLVDVVIPFFGDVDFVKQAVACVPEACGDIPYSLILVDNGSPDQAGRDLFLELKGQGLDFKEIWVKTNSGYPGGVNAGVHAGSSPLVFILTADVVMDPGSIAQAVMDMDDPEIGVVGAKLLFPQSTPHGQAGKVQHAGLAMNLSASIFHIFIGWSADHPKVNTRRIMYAITGAAFMTRRKLFMQIGGMEIAYGRGTFEDVEYCLRAKSFGAKVLYDPLVSGTHYVGGAADKGANGGGFALQQNQQLFMARNGHALEWDEWRYW